MARDLGAIAMRLFTDVMAPLVLGGAMRPGHVIGVRSALELSTESAPPVDPDLSARLRRARVRRARALVPIDDVGPPSGAEWALAAALHDLVQAAHPALDSVFRRRSATRILENAEATIEAVAVPMHAREALSRHTWFARTLEVARTDSVVSWWIGSRAFLGVEPPERLQAWPELRRVHVTRTPRPLASLTPIAVDRGRLVEVLGKLLAASPLTDLMTCTRTTPPFVWSAGSVSLVSTRAGRALAARGLARLPCAEIDAALGRASREAMKRTPQHLPAALMLLAERAIALVTNHLAASRGSSVATDVEAHLARTLGAAAATRALAARSGPWSEMERSTLLRALESGAREGEAAMSGERPIASGGAM